MTQHTPGPWVIHETETQILGGRSLGTSICNLFIKAWERTGTKEALGIAEVHRANARLIAAAPDLLDALRECVSEDGALCWRNHEFAKRRLAHITEIARGALAKAEGKP